MADLERFKLSSLQWDGDKDEDGFFSCVENFGNIAKSIAYGPMLEDMLDSKLRRAKVAQGAIPSYILNDPDFAKAPEFGVDAPAAPEDPAPEEEAAESATKRLEDLKPKHKQLHHMRISSKQRECKSDAFIKRSRMRRVILEN